MKKVSFDMILPLILICLKLRNYKFGVLVLLVDALCQSFDNLFLIR